VDLNIAGGNPPYSVSLVTGELPPGLNLAGETIAGTLSSAKGSRFMLRVVDNLGAALAQRFQITAVGAVDISNQSLPRGRAGRSYTARLIGRSGKKPFTWSLAAGSLPSGVTLDSTAGRITGTPVSQGDTSLTFQVTDSLGGVAQKTLTLTVQ
jgi:hypothetical protein